MNEGRRAWFERDGGDDGEEENGEEERGEEGDGIGLGRCERTGVEEELELEKEPRELSACSASICLRLRCSHSWVRSGWTSSCR